MTRRFEANPPHATPGVALMENGRAVETVCLCARADWAPHIAHAMNAIEEAQAEIAEAMNANGFLTAPHPEAPAERASKGEGSSGHAVAAADDQSFTVTYPTLRAANLARQAEWCPEQIPDLSFRGNELAGETGEACNVIKKLERERLGWRGSRATTEELGAELADVVICADLVAIAAGIDLDAEVEAKFNATSEKVGLPARYKRGAA